ncbi:MAG: hypothetical protein DMG41_16520 [Acidobacteria bacterium]|nr:MAG: hypothetical protein DMG41_16520 [Acidobacteriota bacterium]
MSVNRRDFLRIGTGGAVAASLALESLPAQVPESSVSTETRRIDFHSHAFPAELLRSLGKYYPEIIHYKEDPVRGPYAIHAGTPLPAWDDSLRIKDIQAAGVDVEVLSCPPLYTALDDHLPELCRLVNDRLAGSCLRYPRRFKAFAHLPFNDMDALLKEMSRCLDQLGFVGVFITSNIGGHYLDAPQFEEFWHEADKRRVPVFLHPLLSPCYQDSEQPPIFSFPYESTLAVTRLITRGLYERFPNVVLVVAHLGGTLPYLAHRIDLGHEIPALRTPEWKISRPPSEYMKKLYFDTAMGWSRGAFNCARDLVGIEHLVLGTDYFIRESGWMGRTTGFLSSLDIKPAERELISYQNASRILKLS